MNSEFPETSRPAKLPWLLRWLFLCVLYVNGASALLHAFMSQWGKQIGESMEAALTFDLPRPFAYRVLTPAVINALEFLTPASVRSAVLGYQDFLGRPVVDLAARHYEWGEADFSFVALNAWLFGVFLCMAFIWRAIIKTTLERHIDTGRCSAIIADLLPMACFILLPTTFVRGGYMYDPADLCLGSLGFLFFLRERWWCYYACLAVALVNKESSVLMLGWFAAYLAPSSESLLSASSGRKPLQWIGLHTLAHIALGGLAVLVLYTAFAENGGGAVQHRLSENLSYWSSGIWLATTQDTHAAGIPLPAALNAVNLVLLIGFVFYACTRAPRHLSYALLGATVIVIPLFIPFGFRDEVRVLGPTVIPVLLAVGAQLLAGGRASGGAV